MHPQIVPWSGLSLESSETGSLPAWVTGQILISVRSELLDTSVSLFVSRLSIRTLSSLVEGECDQSNGSNSQEFLASVASESLRRAAGGAWVQSSTQATLIAPASGDYRPTKDYAKLTVAGIQAITTVLHSFLSRGAPVARLLPDPTAQSRTMELTAKFAWGLAVHDIGLGVPTNVHPSQVIETCRGAHHLLVRFAELSGMLQHGVASNAILRFCNASEELMRAYSLASSLD